MQTKFIVALVLYGIVALFFVLIGVVYLTRKKITAYHTKFIGRTHEQLEKEEPRFARIAIFFLKIVGGANLAIGVATILLLVATASIGYTHIAWPMLAMHEIALVPALYVTYSVGRPSPWPAVMVVMVSSLVAFFLIV